MSSVTPQCSVWVSDEGRLDAGAGSVCCLCSVCCFSVALLETEGEGGLLLPADMFANTSAACASSKASAWVCVEVQEQSF